jgi:hypothetical protein
MDALHVRAPAVTDGSVLDWLLDSDPAIRWQTLRDLTDATSDDVARERARVATEGWGATVLGRQTPNGSFQYEMDTDREWVTFLALVWLRDLGLDPESAQAQRAIALVRDNVTWHWWDNNPFFVGEVEPCINGRVLALGAYFGQDTERVLARLLGEQMDDGGWNCEQENGATVGSFHTTINVLEGLLEYERANGETRREVATARRKGEEYLLERRLLRRLSTGEVIDPSFTEFGFPSGYHYDVLRALDYFRQADLRDGRQDEAVAIVEEKRQPDGRWLLDVEHPDQMDIGTGERAGQASRWITLRASRVLRWAGRG